MKPKHYLIALIITMLLGAIAGGLGIRSCQDACTCTTDTTYTTQIIAGDSIPYPVQVKVPVPVYVDSIVFLPGQNDTASILEEYFKSKYYTDTIREEGNFLAVVKDSVNFNRIVYRAFDFQNLKTTAIYTTTITHQQCNIPPLGLGLEGIINSERLYVGPAVYYLTKNHQAFKLGLQFSIHASPALSMGYYKQINIKK